VQHFTKTHELFIAMDHASGVANMASATALLKELVEGSLPEAPVFLSH
jgi:hypothetical protein